MSSLPSVSGKEAVRAFKKDGWFVDRVNGSHHILKHENSSNRLSIPVHSNRSVGWPLLKSQIRAADMTIERFLELL
jgi:predicted RNA binding protein YcfA (HicA-like mRNA interferase family)